MSSNGLTAVLELAARGAGMGRDRGGVPCVGARQKQMVVWSGAVRKGGAGGGTTPSKDSFDSHHQLRETLEMPPRW